MNTKVAVDIDGVLADFEGAFCEEFGYERRELVDLESRYPSKAISIAKFINSGEVYKRLKPIRLGLDIVDYLNSFMFDVCIVTGRPFGIESVTRDWLKKNKVEFDSCTSSRAKVGVIALLKPLCAVDDLFGVHAALLKHNIPTILIAQPWNRYSGEKIRRISTLDEFIASFNYIIQENKGK